MKLENIAHIVYNIRQRIFQSYSSINVFSAFWWGVKLGRNAKFIGRCYFKKYPGTEIIIGDNCTFLSKNNANLIGINRPCMITTLHSSYHARIIIGNNCGFSGTVIGAFRHISIGSNVRCGANTLITDADWHLDDYRSGEPKKVIIEDNVWLGVNSVILKGVTIGTNTVIGANSVVTKNIPANVIAAGNPCKVIKQLNGRANNLSEILSFE